MFQLDISKSLTAEDAKAAKEKNSFTAKGAKDARKLIIKKQRRQDSAK